MAVNKVAIVMGSKSDMAVAEKAETVLKEFDVDYVTHIISAHRNPNRIRVFTDSLEDNEFGVVIDNGLFLSCQFSEPAWADASVI